MSIVLSLQGSMAVGKTTAARYVGEQLPQVLVSYEDPFPVVEQVKKLGLDKSTFVGFTEIQRLFIRAEILRWQAAQRYPVTLFDTGPEEIEFHTLHYPRTIGASWSMETALEEELAKLRCCRPDRVLFLDAGVDTLRHHKDSDTTRRRGSFDFYIDNMLDAKRKWLADHMTVDFVPVDKLSPLQVGELVVDWVKGLM